MQLIPGEDYTLFKGYPLSCYVSGDGSVFWAGTASHPDGKTVGTFVFRQVLPNRYSEVINLPFLVGEKGVLCLSEDGLFLSVFSPDGQANMVRIPGFLILGDTPRAVAPTVNDDALIYAQNASASAQDAISRVLMMQRQLQVNDGLIATAIEQTELAVELAETAKQVANQRVTSQEANTIAWTQGLSAFDFRMTQLIDGTDLTLIKLINKLISGHIKDLVKDSHLVA